jgi:hypothetical protein
LSNTLPQVRARVNALLNNLDAKRPIDLVRVDQNIRNAYITLQARMPAAETETASAGTITAGSDTFSLPTTSSAEYAGLVWIRLRSNGEFLTHVTVEEMNALRAGNASIVTGTPRYFALWEDSTQTVQGRCESAPASTETYDLFKTAVASDFDATALDSTTIALSRYGIQALIYQAAAEIAASLTEEDLALRRLNPAVIKVWFQQAEIMLNKECQRRNDLESVGRVQRWTT